ncbi:DNA-binding response regulator [Amycolatopsis sp. 195334CR]|uniref:DNA-binding response regulator n=1 Tax=Amycolatopsis sp. 195334CR TaxID=2814588 RepID=UPI001A8F0266|nr:DNA-binding response regulator [Amycolatopsis sp. 195334CR]MBN6036094.1 DNA-binding response regulator [Amycolatopsis sp. 195334CR]
MELVITVVKGEEELFARTAHLFASATEVACAAADLRTFAVSQRPPVTAADHRGKRVRKIYRPPVLLEPVAATHLEQLVGMGADIRISADEINETIILDRRVVILAGDLVAGTRSYSVLTAEETVQGVVSLFEAAWRGATELAVYDARVAEIRVLAPRILDMLASGCKDETAARSLGLGLRTYRRRVAELMTALGATSRFQAGVRAGELGLL